MSRRIDYEAMYRKLNPKSCPMSAVEQQRELRDLWPAKQEEFKRMIDKLAEEYDRHDQL